MKTNTVTFSIFLLVFMVFSSAFVLKNNATKKANEKTFQELIALFPKDNGLTFELGTSFYQKSKKEQDAFLERFSNDNLMDYVRYLPYARFESSMRRNPSYYYPIQLIETEKNIAFIYCKTNGFSSYIYNIFYASVLTKDGKSVHHEMISKGTNYNEVVAFKINRNLILEKTFYLQSIADQIYNNNKFVLSPKRMEKIDLKIEPELKFFNQYFKHENKYSHLFNPPFSVHGF